MNKVYVLYYRERTNYHEPIYITECVYENYEDGASDFRDMVQDTKDKLKEYFCSGADELAKKWYERCSYSFNLFSDGEKDSDLNFNLIIGTLLGKKISVCGYYEARTFIPTARDEEEDDDEEDEDIELDFEQAVEDAVHSVATSHMKDIVQQLHLRGWECDDAGEVFKKMKEPDVLEELQQEAPEVVEAIAKEESEAINGFTAQNKLDKAIEEIVSETKEDEIAKEIDEVLSPTEEGIYTSLRETRKSMAHLVGSPEDVYDESDIEEVQQEITTAVKTAIQELEQEEAEVTEAAPVEEAPVQEAAPVEEKKEVERPKVTFSKLSF